MIKFLNKFHAEICEKPKQRIGSRFAGIALATASLLLPPAAVAGKDAAYFDTLPHVGSLTGRTIYISPFEIDALSCLSTVLDADCDVNGIGLLNNTGPTPPYTTNYNSSWDFTTVTLNPPNIDPAFPYPSDNLSVPATTNNPLRFTGIAPVGNFAQVIDGGLSGCADTPEFNGIPNADESAYNPTNASQLSNPYPEPDVANVTQGKTDVCTFYSAIETVRVIDDIRIPDWAVGSNQPGDLSAIPPPYAYDQNHTILYLGLRVNPNGTGDRSYLLPLYENAFDQDDCITWDPSNPANNVPLGCESDGQPIRPDGVFALEWNQDPSSGPSFTLSRWDDPDQDGSGVWTDVQTNVTQGPTVDCEWTCLGDNGPEACVGNDNLYFAECAVDITGLAQQNDTPLNCIGGSIPNLISRTGNAKNSSLKDVVRRPPLFTGNCGEVRIDKQFYSNDRSNQYLFPYEVWQTDYKPVHDDTLNNATPPYPLNPTPPSGDLTPLDLFPFFPSGAAPDEYFLTGLFAYNTAGAPATDNKSDLWQNVLAEPDYYISEELPLADPDDAGPLPRPRMWKVECSYYDIYTGQRVSMAPYVCETPIQPPATPTSDQTVPCVTPLPLFHVAPNPYMGVDDVALHRTECTIYNYDPTIPITLGSFLATEEGGSITFTWSTVTEVAHIGFNLYVEDDDGQWTRINEDVIPPLKAGDSFEVREYSYSASGVKGERFMISDLSAGSAERKHGPFQLGVFYGMERGTRTPTDWEGIKAQHEKKQKARKLKSQQQFKQKLKKIKENNGKSDKVSLRNQQQPLLQRVADTLLGLLVGNAHAAAEPVGDAGHLFIDVTSPGLHRVTYEQFAAAGFDLESVEPSMIGLTHHGMAIPVFVSANKKGRSLVFGAGSYIEFVAPEFEHYYTDKDSFALFVDGSQTLAATEESASPPRKVTPVTTYQRTVRFEEDAKHAETNYSTSTPNGDPWVSAVLMSYGGPTSVNLDLPVENYVAGAGPVDVEVGLWGFTLGRHQGSISLNGSEIADYDFLGQEEHVLGESDIQPSLLNDGANTISVSVPGSAGVMDFIALDSWSVTYPSQLKCERCTFSVEGSLIQLKGLPSNQVSIYRTSSDGDLVRLTDIKVKEDADGGYLAEFAGTQQPADYHVSAASAYPAVDIRAVPEQSDLLTRKAEYLVISHPDFIDEAMDDLVAARSNQYVSVKVADTEAIYAQFGGGVFGSQPIKDYITWAASNLGTEVVLLVGSDVRDYFNRLGYDAVSFLPSIYTSTGSLITHVPCDTCYADIDNDDFPDLQIGRLIPRTSDEWREMVNKTLSYGSDTAVMMKSLFAADSKEDDRNISYSDHSNELIAELPETWRQDGFLTTAYMDDDPEGAHDLVVNTLNAGVSLASYVGHSGSHDWRMFRSADAAALTNTSPFVVTQWGCWNTYYVVESEDSMAHEFLRNATGGAAAVMGPTGLTGVNSEKALGKALYKVMFDPGKTLGEAILEAKGSIVGSPLDVILGWSLIGDPGLVIGQ